MKHLIISVAGLGYDDALAHLNGAINGVPFKSMDSVFPAVTCTSQASFRTASEVADHGMVSNGIFLRNLQKPFFWEQSSELVSGRRIWENARKKGNRVALLFFQQSLGECADVILSPTPIHKHSGTMILGSYGKPAGLESVLQKDLGVFPLHRYWGPMASPKVGDAVVANVLKTIEIEDPEIVFCYLPTLDYDLQRFGPNDQRVAKSFTLLGRQLEGLISVAERMGSSVTIYGDYSITPSPLSPVMPNVLLREKGLFNVRMVQGMAYPDFYTSRAFAMVDHEIAHVYVRNADDIEETAMLFNETGDYSEVLIKEKGMPWAHKNSGEILLVAQEGSWCAYPWWKRQSEAPDYATHVDIHNKPGYDPCELFLGKIFPPGTTQNFSRIKGTHGRQTKVAYASTIANGDTTIELAKDIGQAVEK